MHHKAKGWVVINIGHPRTGNSFILPETFSYKRKGAVKKFIEGSGNSWTYWRNKFNFRVVKSSLKIIVGEL